MSQKADALEPGAVQRGAAAAASLYIVALVALPLAAVIAAGLERGLPAFFAAVSSEPGLSALWLSIWTAFVVAVLDALLGTATAWVLVRRRFPGKAFLSAAIDLPFAIPTLVAGVMLGLAYGPDTVLGRAFAAHGVEIMFARPGIVLALAFVTMPFVVRAVEPVLLEIDPAEEEAARMLGASPWRAFRTVYLPAIGPSALSSAIRALGRALGEFGSLVVVAGNVPLRTLTAPVYVFGQIESGAPHAAAAQSVVLLGLALAMHGAAIAIERSTGARHV